MGNCKRTSSPSPLDRPPVSDPDVPSTGPHRGRRCDACKPRRLICQGGLAGRLLQINTNGVRDFASLKAIVRLGCATLVCGLMIYGTVPRLRIVARLDLLTENRGDWKSLGGGLYELRIDYGPGYRVFYAQDDLAAVWWNQANTCERH